MRQSDGNKTEKRRSATRRGHPAKDEEESPETIEGLTPTALAWLARTRSSLLLKTASLHPAVVSRG